ncbi:hypothetical protein ACHQM5_004245 [Ranunculus cassubicifolius]
MASFPFSENQFCGVLIFCDFGFVSHGLVSCRIVLIIKGFPFSLKSLILLFLTLFSFFSLFPLIRFRFDSVLFAMVWFWKIWPFQSSSSLLGIVSVLFGVGLLRMVLIEDCLVSSCISLGLSCFGMAWNVSTMEMFCVLVVILEF